MPSSRTSSSSAAAPRVAAPQVVVVTGASAGLGRAVAHAFAKRGARVALLARGEAALRDVQRECERHGGQGLPIVTDVADAEQVEAAAERVEREWGPIDVWVNDAMTTVFAPLHEIAAADYARATAVTYLGTVYGTMSALKRMRPRDRGAIVQVGSALAYRAIPLQAPYCGAKHAVRGFTDSLRCELLHDRSGIRLTMVQMPALNTPQFNWCKSELPRHPQPVPPIYQPEVGAEAVYWASRHGRRELNVGYPAVVAIWGNKFLPALGDRYLARTAYAGQQTDRPVANDRPFNLYDTVEDGHATHGIFDARATTGHLPFWLTSHRAVTLMLLAALLLLFALGMLAGWLLPR